MSDSIYHTYGSDFEDYISEIISDYEDVWENPLDSEDLHETFLELLSVGVYLTQMGEEMFFSARGGGINSIGQEALGFMHNPIRNVYGAAENYLTPSFMVMYSQNHLSVLTPPHLQEGEFNTLYKPLIDGIERFFKRGDTFRSAYLRSLSNKMETISEYLGTSKNYFRDTGWPDQDIEAWDTYVNVHNNMVDFHVNHLKGLPNSTNDRFDDKHKPIERLNRLVFSEMPLVDQKVYAALNYLDAQPEVIKKERVLELTSLGESEVDSSREYLLSIGAINQSSRYFASIDLNLVDLDPNESYEYATEDLVEDGQQNLDGLFDSDSSDEGTTQNVSKVSVEEVSQDVQDVDDGVRIILNEERENLSFDDLVKIQPILSGAYNLASDSQVGVKFTQGKEEILFTYDGENGFQFNYNKI